MMPVLGDGGQVPVNTAEAMGTGQQYTITVTPGSEWEAGIASLAGNVYGTAGETITQIVTNTTPIFGFTAMAAEDVESKDEETPRAVLTIMASKQS